MFDAVIVRTHGGLLSVYDLYDELYVLSYIYNFACCPNKNKCKARIAGGRGEENLLLLIQCNPGSEL